MRSLRIAEQQQVLVAPESAGGSGLGYALDGLELQYQQTFSADEPSAADEWLLLMVDSVFLLDSNRGAGGSSNSGLQG